MCSERTPAPLPYRASVQQRLTALQRFRDVPPKNITIVGAGMAGLVAAVELTALGHRVRVLEATLRPGGRAHTWRPDNDDHYHEFGAMRIPAAHDFTRYYVERAGLGLREFVTAHKDDDAWFFLRGHAFRMNEAGPHVGQLYELHLADRTQIAAISPQTPVTARPTIPGILLGQVFGPVLGALTPNDERALLLEGPATELSARLEAMTLGELVSQHLRGADAADLAGVATGLDVWWHICAAPFIREEFLKDGPPFDEIIGGTDALPRALADELDGDAITYNAAVTAIDITNGKVALRTVEDGRTRTREDHDLVLCTLPFGVLRAMKLTGFSPQKMAAIRTMNYESATKVLLLCQRRRWEEQQITGGATLSDTILRQTYYPSDHHRQPSGVSAPHRAPATETLYRVEHPDPKESMAFTASHEEPGVLVASYSWGRDARRMGAMPHEQRVTACLEVLEMVHPGISDDVTQSASMYWDVHPWARGAFSMPHPNETPAHLNNGRRPEGRLYFAGEHLSFNPGWMQGAIISALTAVDAMLSAPD